MTTEELELAPADAPDIATLKRVDAPAIWQEFTAKLEPLEAASLALVVTDASQLDIAKQADEKRKAVKALRCAVENKRVELVAGMNKSLKAINTEAGAIWDRCEAVEKHLKEQVEFAENAERERVAKLQAERAEKVRSAGGDPKFYDLGKMPEEGFAQMIEALEVAAQLKRDREAKAEAERIAAEQAEEEARLAKEKADAEERERQRVEMERLKAEAEEREAALKKEREERERERAAAEKLRLEAERKADAERKAAEEKARREREELERVAEAERRAAHEAAEAERRRVEAECAAERAKAQKERQAIEAKAKAEREKLEAEARRLRAEQEQRERDEAHAAQIRAEEEARAMKAPDREKLLTIAAKLQSVTLPSLTSKEGKAILSDVIAALEKKAGAM